MAQTYKYNTIINSWDFITRFSRSRQIVFLHYTRTLSWLASSGSLVFFSLVANFCLRMISVVLQTSRLSTILPTCKSFLYPFFCVSTVSPALFVNRNEFCNSPSDNIPMHTKAYTHMHVSCALLSFPHVRMCEIHIQIHPQKLYYYVVGAHSMHVIIMCFFTRFYF